jgi:hypothetical protein
MRLIVTAALVALFVSPAFARTHAQDVAASRAKLAVSTQSARRDTREEITAPDANAPGNGWGKTAPKATGPHKCDYGSAMSDADIEACSR